MYVYESVSVFARENVYDPPQWFHVFDTSLIYIIFDVIMNRHGHHNIRIGILWAQTGNSTSTCTATLCEIEL